MEDYRVYSEEEYYDRTQLLNIYSPTVCDCIWEEIVNYRKQFRYEIHFQSRTTYVTLNKTLFEKMLRIYELSLPKDLNDQKLHGYEDEQLGTKEILLKYMNHNQMSISQNMFHFLMGSDFLLLKIFVIYEYICDLDFLYLFLYLYNHIEWFPIIEKIEISKDINNNYPDLTRKFRDFLDSFYFLSTDNVIQLIGTTFEQMDIEELLALYPTCNKKQIYFYTKCAKKNHYYTISQYMEMNHVSYETARKAMEHLVKLNFYRKIKIGKKFVFTPC